MNPAKPNAEAIWRRRVIITRKGPRALPVGLHNMALAILKIRLYGDACLRKKSSPIKEVGPSERMLIQSMIATMQQAKGVGLAAPQVGINQRLFVVDVGEGPMAIINPKIIKISGKDVLEEGCLSIPEVNIMIKRSQKIRVQYLNENGQKKVKTCEDLMARVIQHETDHLDGKLIIDYASSEEKDKFKDQLDALEANQKE